MLRCLRNRARLRSVMSAFGGKADRARLILAYPNKIRHFLQSIFPATPAGKTMGRRKRLPFSNKKAGPAVTPGEGVFVKSCPLPC
jgi:hypothetical protein